ncbi:uncharacterized protein [Amphiura filiformis]|uniref:uncharacterized protein n=1 Tax=Amphiura filiformis TaxID=82378 RepID=UPI003B21C91D
MEQTKGRAAALDLLISQLLELQTPNWIQIFQSLLRQHYPRILEVIETVRGELVGDDLVASCRYQVSKMVTPRGDVLELPDVGVRLEVPTDALDKDELISVSVMATRESHPPLGDRFIVGPIVRLEPDRIELRRPVTLTVRHSGIDLTQQNLQIWTKVESYGDTEAWEKEFDGAAARNDPDTYLSNKSIKIRRTHFCWWCFLGRCSLEVQILPFIEKDLYMPKATVVSVAVYAVKRDDAKMVEDNIKTSGKKVLCCDKPTKCYPSAKCKDLTISLKNVTDKKRELSWGMSSATEIIQAADLQVGCGNASCNFNLLDTLETTDSILGTLNVTQEGNRSLDVYIDYMMTKEAAASSAPVSENYVKACEAIQALCFISLPTVEASVERWHQIQQQQMQPCLGTAQCLPNKKPTPKSGACKPCIDWANAVQSTFYPHGKGVQWRNVNAALFHKDPVEVAKGFVFIIPPGQNCTTFGDFDIGGILKLMMGFADYHNGDPACYANMQQVLDIRNSLSHMKVKDNMRMSDKQLDTCFDAIKTLVSSLQVHQPTLKADKIQSCLSKIRRCSVTTAMIVNALGDLSDSLKQSLDEGLKQSEARIVGALGAELALQLEEIKQGVKTNQEMLTKMLTGSK